jgi:lipid A 3-O-deacylase
MGLGVRAAAAAAIFLLSGASAWGEARAAEALVGLYRHDVTFLGNFVGLGAAGREHGADLHLGYRTDPVSALGAIGSPQVHAFVSINSQLKSNFAAVGLDWRVPLGGRFYVRPGIGLALTDGKTVHPSATEPGISLAEQDRRASLYYNRIAFGSRILFEPELALGIQVNERLSVEGSYVHLSNGQIFHQGKNQGLDDVGVRLVWKLGR